MTEPQSVRIKITTGNLSIEYEGKQSFIENGLLQLAEEIFSLAPATASISTDTINEQTTSSDVGHYSTNTIAQIISAKTGTDLVLAAIARINLVKKIPVAARSDILDEMKEATTYFKDSYASNLTSYLDTLVKSRKVNLTSRSNYALAAAERARFEGALQGA